MIKLKTFILSIMFAAPLVAANPLLMNQGNKKDEYDPVETVQKRYKELFINKDRYKLPSHLSNEDATFKGLSDREKEERLREWFSEKESKNFGGLAYKEFLYVSGFVIVTVSIFLLLFRVSYAKIGGILYKFFLSILKGEWFGNLEEGLEELAKLLAPLLKNIWLVFGFLNKEKESSPQAQGVPEEGDKINNLFTFIVLYYTLQYFSAPATWLWKQLRYSLTLYKLLRDPVYESRVVRIEEKYIESMYLFDDKQKRIIESLLLASHAGEVTKLSEVETFILMQRALPKGVKKVTYDQEAIDEALIDYSPELKELVENIISILVIYTDAIEAGREDLVEGLPIKPTLLFGPPGTGKSHLIKLICEITGLNATYISFAGEYRVEFKGKSGEKHWLGLPSAYMRALMASTDEWGRNYQNNIIIIEEVSSYFHDRMTVNYLKIFLDPKVSEVQDVYMRVPLPKLPIIFATSNELPTVPALRDRFMIYHAESVQSNNKKGIINRSLVPIWTDLLADPALQSEYDQKLNENEVQLYLQGKLLKYIDERDSEGSMRGCEEEAFWQSMNLIKERIKKKKESKRGKAKQQSEATTA